MGAKKKPTPLKLLQGTYRKERENPNEPIYAIEIPRYPGHLSESAIKEWLRISVVLHNQGLLTNVDMACLAAYCQAYGRWVDAENELYIDGRLIIKTISGNVIQNPLVGIANTALKLMKDCLTEFGMTPASRSKVSSKNIKKPKNDWGDI